MALMTSRPPGLRRFIASPIGPQTGVVSTIASIPSGGISSIAPVQAAPSDRANSRSLELRLNTQIFELGYLYLAIFNTRWLDPPNPIRPRVCPFWRLHSFKARYPTAPAHNKGAASESEMDFGMGCTKSARTFIYSA